MCSAVADDFEETLIEMAELKQLRSSGKEREGTSDTTLEQTNINSSLIPLGLFIRKSRLSRVETRL